MVSYSFSLLLFLSTFVIFYSFLFCIIFYSMLFLIFSHDSCVYLMRNIPSIFSLLFSLSPFLLHFICLRLWFAPLPPSSFFFFTVIFFPLLPFFHPLSLSLSHSSYSSLYIFLSIYCITAFHCFLFALFLLIILLSFSITTFR